MKKGRIMEKDMKKTKRATKTDLDRARRMKWWHDARFGMFIHWGLYSQLGRHEWAMNRERIPVAEYERLADVWNPKPRPMRQWAKLARQAGMKYMVLTTKHHDGFCLWRTKQTNYNAFDKGPKRDLVQEYVDACHEFGLKTGFYYSLMDWHHPNGAKCARNEKARRNFLDFTQGCVRELMSNYGTIDILWYDVSWPLKTPELWESARMNAMVRELQPQILINNRSQLPEDFGTPEEKIKAEETGRAWEACMTFNGFWGYKGVGPSEDWLSSRKVVGMLRQVTAGGGNLLLNIGPEPDGTVPPEAIERLTAVGQWVKRNAEAIYGKVGRCDGLFDWLPLGAFTRNGNTAYFWCHNWPGRELAIGGFKTKLRRASLLTDGKTLPFHQERDRLVIYGLPSSNPDKLLNTTLIKMEFAGKPKQILGWGCEMIGHS
jgi:alpha-L-fucosidase